MPSWIIRWTLCGCEWEDKSEVERVKLLLRRKQLHCLWGKTICVTSDLQGVTADTWGADHSSCLMWCCALLSMWGKRKERRDFDTRYFHSSARSCVLLWSCGLYVTHASLLGAISSLAWQPSQLVSCSSSPGIREMARSPVVNKTHGSRGVCWCRLWTVGCSRLEQRSLISHDQVQNAFCTG